VTVYWKFTHLQKNIGIRVMEVMEFEDMWQNITKKETIRLLAGKGL
jgi:hypothetical protein